MTERRSQSSDGQVRRSVSSTARSRASSAPNPRVSSTSHSRVSGADARSAAVPRKRVSADQTSVSQRRPSVAVSRANRASRASVPVVSQNTKDKRGVVGTVGSAFVTLFYKSRIAFFGLALVCLLLVAGGVDAVLNFNKIYGGVMVGTVDVSGKTREQAAELIAEAYRPVLEGGSAYVFANDIASASVNGAIDPESETPVAEQQAVLDALAAGQLWIATAESLGATIDAQALAEEAFQVGRDNGGLGARLKVLFGGWDVSPSAQYDEAKLESFALAIDGVIGSPRVDYGVRIEGSAAVVTEGNDGTMLDREQFAQQLTTALLSGSRGSFVAQASYAPLRISAAQAQEVANAINRAVSAGSKFVLGNGGWDFTATDTASYVCTKVEKVEDAYILLPYVDVERVHAYVLDRSTGLMRASLPASVTFSEKNGQTMVSTDGSGSIPKAAETAALFDELMFGAFRSALIASAGLSIEGSSSQEVTSVAPDGVTPVTVEVVVATPPKSMTLEEALEFGVVVPFSSFTTEYTNNPDDANRNHNIQLAASILDGSIVKANGGQWSFHEVVGHCNSEAGFLGAGIILNEEHVDAVGGGICQVATTVFNAVYEAGLQIDRRHNHTLYVGYYPDGRDAAVSWPDLDFIWSNDTVSDILVDSSHTDTSLTVTLYGVHPQRDVSTYTTEWKVLQKHPTRLTCDEGMSKGTSKVMQEGDDARSITVYRTVYDKDGRVIHENVFSSKYDSEVEIIVAGPGTEITLESGKKLVAEAGKTVSGT